MKTESRLYTIMTSNIDLRPERVIYRYENIGEFLGPELFDIYKVASQMIETTSLEEYDKLDNLLETLCDATE